MVWLDDYESAEKEYTELISQEEALGELCIIDVAQYTHDLIHFFAAPRWDPSIFYGRIQIPLGRLEEIMQFVVSFCSVERLSNKQAYFRACALGHLRSFYETTLQDVNLAEFLENVEEELSAIHLLDSKEIRTLKRGVAASFSRLGMSEKAEWWFLHVLQEVETSPHAPPREALTIQIDIAQMYLSQGHRKQAQEYFERAQKLAHDILPQDHPFHEHIRRSLLERKPVGGCCPECHITPMTPHEQDLDSDGGSADEEEEEQEENQVEGNDNQDDDDEGDDLGSLTN